MFSYLTLLSGICDVTPDKLYIVCLRLFPPVAGLSFNRRATADTVIDGWSFKKDVRLIFFFPFSESNFVPSGQHHLLTVCVSSLAKDLGRAASVSPCPISAIEFNSKRQLHAVFGWRSILPRRQDRKFCCCGFVENNAGTDGCIRASELRPQAVSPRWRPILCAKKFRTEPCWIPGYRNFRPASALAIRFRPQNLVPTPRSVC